MGQQHHIFQGQELRHDPGLVLVDIEPSPGQMPVLQDPDQSLLIDQGPSGRVDDEAIGLHRAQRLLVEQMSGPVMKRCMQGDHIAGGQQIIETPPFGLQLLLEIDSQSPTLVIEGVHTEDEVPEPARPDRFSRHR